MCDVRKEDDRNEKLQAVEYLSMEISEISPWNTTKIKSEFSP